MGNDAAHELQAPAAPAELEAALSIVENLLPTLYVLPETACQHEKKPSAAYKDESTETQGEVAFFIPQNIKWNYGKGREWKNAITLDAKEFPVRLLKDKPGTDRVYGCQKTSAGFDCQ